jgi:hypothetical protein
MPDQLGRCLCKKPPVNCEASFHWMLSNVRIDSSHRLRNLTTTKTQTRDYSTANSQVMDLT